jgi:membrane protease YdiL (CAAX protease family)
MSEPRIQESLTAFPQVGEAAAEPQARGLVGDDGSAADTMTPPPLAPVVAMEVVDFLPPEPVASRVPGPGLPEALLWSFGVFGAHVVVGIVLLSVIVTAELIKLLVNGATLDDLQRELARVDLISGSSLLMFVGGEQLLVLLATLIAVGLRFSGRVLPTLNLSAPRALHVLLIAGLMLPLSILSGELYRVVHYAWVQLTELAPLLSLFDAANSVEAMRELSQSASLPLLVLVIAVGPAIGEELVFRGVIGRGLVARWGILPGVLITSFLFAAVHLHPAHVLAVVPLGIAMHLIYLATRSFWAPMLLHFLNNAWATVATKLSTEGEIDPAVVDQAASPVLLLASITAVVVLAGLLYRTRTRYLQPDGREWDPGYFTVEAPADGQAYRLDFGGLTGRSLLTAASAWVAFGAAFLAEVVSFAR